VRRRPRRTDNAGRLTQERANPPDIKIHSGQAVYSADSIIRAYKSKKRSVRRAHHAHSWPGRSPPKALRVGDKTAQRHFGESPIRSLVSQRARRCVEFKVIWPGQLSTFQARYHRPASARVDPAGRPWPPKCQCDRNPASALATRTRARWPGAPVALRIGSSIQ
jgi:hypothetical protein